MTAELCDCAKRIGRSAPLVSKQYVENCLFFFYVAFIVWECPAAICTVGHYRIGICLIKSSRVGSCAVLSGSVEVVLSGCAKL